MIIQQLEYARLNIASALLDTSGKTKGQLQAFCEHPPADKERNPRKPVHVVELDDGKGSTYSVKAENSALYVMETRSRRRPMPPINDIEFSAAPWRRAVNALPGHKQSWLRYCYGFDLSFSHQTAICEHVWDRYQNKLTRKIQERVRKKLIGLVWLAAQEVAAKNKNESYKEYAGAALASMLSISRPTWKECYATVWQEFKQAFEDLDQEALCDVLAMCK